MKILFFHTHTFTWSHCCCSSNATMWSFSSKHNLPPLEQITNKTYHWQHIVVVPRSNEINEISINCDQILRHGNKDVKEYTIIIPWNIYGSVLITNFVVNSFLRGLIAHQWWMVYIVDRRKSSGSLGTTFRQHPVLSAHAWVNASASCKQWRIVNDIFQDGGRRFGTIFAKFNEIIHLWDILRTEK